MQEKANTENSLEVLTKPASKNKTARNKGGADQHLGTAAPS